jgi:hypothetical protein
METLAASRSTIEHADVLGFRIAVLYSTYQHKMSFYNIAHVDQQGCHPLLSIFLD